MKIPLTANLESACGLWQSSGFFSSTDFQIGQHVALIIDPICTCGVTRLDFCVVRFFRVLHQVGRWTMVLGASWGIRAVGHPCQGDHFVKVTRPCTKNIKAALHCDNVNQVSVLQGHFFSSSLRSWDGESRRDARCWARLGKSSAAPNWSLPWTKEFPERVKINLLRCNPTVTPAI